MSRKRKIGGTFVNVGFRLAVDLTDRWRELLADIHLDGSEAMRRLIVAAIKEHKIPGIDPMILPVTMAPVQEKQLQPPEKQLKLGSVGRKRRHLV